ncbi:MAG: PDZ domain-containing protein [Pyrinomonadaceae bacterium]
MSQNHGMPLQSAAADPSVTTCSNCRSPMPSDLRFCRNCGFRLGEGPAEYTETVRFPNGGATMLAGDGAASAQQAFTTTYDLSSGAIAGVSGRQMAKQRKRMSGMTWMFLGLLIFFIAAAAFTALITPIRRAAPSISIPAPPRAYIGVSSFENGEGGVTFDNVEPPGSPADKAGLVGGDIITTFDGQVVHDDDEIADLMRRTPIGKTVEVVFIRDGEQKTTKLELVGKEEFDRLGRDFRNRPEGKGRFGYDNDQSERVPIPGTKMVGVRLDEISASLPADMAGIKQGDIVTEFDGVPIRTPEELTSRVRRAIPYSTVKIVLMRGSEKLKIPVKMGRQ